MTTPAATVDAVLRHLTGQVERLAHDLAGETDPDRRRQLTAELADQAARLALWIAAVDAVA